MKSKDRTRQIVDNIARLGVKAKVTKSRAALWSALQGSGEVKGQLKVVTSCHPG
ncbi:MULTISPECIES: Lmo0850 family protein [Domibacillus]|uniref:Lmo0850 family protein n=1 Tax=Domibacillus TaxID=1433999 RepID=UPI000A5401D8|nr:MULTISPECIES: Lmo0850 family protein [Domibacillus]MCP3764015.1 Lmo0850 family protein [Domibacillus sp. A3M-37]